MLAGAVGTTEEDTVNFHAVTNDLTPAVDTLGRERMDGTFKTIEHMRIAMHAHLKTLVVLVSAHFTFADVPIASR